MQVSEVCGVRLTDVNRASGSVTIQGKRGSLRIFHLLANGKQALDTYLDQARLTSTWKLAAPEAQDVLFLTEQRRPLTKNSLEGFFRRLNQRAGFIKAPISPSMIRDTYAIRFLQAGDTLVILQQQLGVTDPASVKRYVHASEQRCQRREKT